jgi:hypothetical protein
MALGLGAGPLALPARAQTIVVAQFPDKTGKARLGKSVFDLVVGAAKERGATVIAWDQYQRTAKKNRIAPAKALLPPNIKKLCAALKLDGVITGRVQLQKKKYVIKLELVGASGKALAQKAYSLGKPVFPPETAAEAVEALLKPLEKSVAAAPEDTGTLGGTSTAAAGTGTPGGTEGGSGGASSTGTSDAFLPPWARGGSETGGTSAAGGGAGAGGGSGGTSATATSSAVLGAGDSGGTSGEVKSAAPEPKRKRSTGAVADALLNAAFSLNHRSGLSPQHKAGIYPGIWVDGRFFLGSFLDVPVVRDIGFGGAFNMSLGLEYKQSGATEAWSASQMQWRGELLYRLAFNDVALGPAFLFRFGFGSTGTTIDAGTGTQARSAAYSYPYANLDIRLVLWKPYLRFFVTGGFLFTVMTSKDVDGSGNGFNVGAGLDLVLFDMLAVGLGWEMIEVSGFHMDGQTAETSDQYHNFLVKVGWNWR